ncbi:MAG: type IV pilus assembly protein PilO [Candidatus Endobugula sp.]|jgi:type IV pilus assembly protein PilO
MSIQDSLDKINSFDINDIDWSRIGVWPIAARIIVVALVMLTVFAGVYFLYVKDLQARLQVEVNNEKSLKTQFQRKSFESATLDQHREILKKMQADFLSLVSQLPKKTEVPGLLDDIYEKGSNSGLDIVSVKLQSEVKDEFYITLPIEIVVTGSYHNLGTFISGIAGMARIVTLHDFTLTPEGRDLKLSIKAQTYRALDEGES